MLIGTNSGGQPFSVRPRPQTRSGGSLYLRSRDLTIEDSDLRAFTVGGDSGVIDVALDRDLTIRKIARDADVGISARTGLALGIDGGLIFLPGDSTTTTIDPFEIVIGGTGPGGDIRIAADSIDLSGGARIATTSQGSGNGGNVEITTRGSMRIDGRDIDSGTPTGIFTNGQGSGDAGDIHLEVARALDLTGGGAIIAQTTGDGDAGSIQVSVDLLSIFGDSQIDSSTSAQSLGAADEGPALGNGGDILVEADGSVVLSGRASDSEFARLSTFSKPLSAGRAGTIVVRTPSLAIENGAGIAATTSGPGEGGNIELDVSNLRLAQGGSIAARSEAASPIDFGAAGVLAPGDAGNVVIGSPGSRFPNQTIELTGGSRITAEAAGAGGGNVLVNVGQPGELLLVRDSAISASVAGGAGSGGNVIVDQDLVVLDSSRISANADEGPGGEIRIRTEALLATADSSIDASSRRGIDGVVEITGPVVDLDASEAASVPGFLDATSCFAPFAPRGPRGIERAA